jgi:hypothetical protein
VVKLIIPKKLQIINIGIRVFYETATNQKVEAVHVNWQPPQQMEKDIAEILERIGG